MLLPMLIAAAVAQTGSNAPPALGPNPNTTALVPVASSPAAASPVASASPISSQIPASTAIPFSPLLGAPPVNSTMVVVSSTSAAVGSIKCAGSDDQRVLQAAISALGI